MIHIVSCSLLLLVSKFRVSCFLSRVSCSVCSLFVVPRPLVVACCMWFVNGLLSVVCCLLIVVRCVLRAVCCFVCCLLILVNCLLWFAVW